MILVIDNYDSFVHNLARYFRQLGCQVVVVRNDAIEIEAIKTMAPAAIVISPGPCTPDQAGRSLEIVRTFAETIPLLGICLGHQAIVQALGGTIVASEQPMHGRSSEIIHHQTAMFRNLPSPFVAGRYHSLIAEKASLPKCLIPTACSPDYAIMAVEHESLPIVGLQFHPESILTPQGYQLLQNFLTIAGFDSPPADPLAMQALVRHTCSPL